MGKISKVPDEIPIIPIVPHTAVEPMPHVTVEDPESHPIVVVPHTSNPSDHAVTGGGDWAWVAIIAIVTILVTLLIIWAGNVFMDWRERR